MGGESDGWKLRWSDATYDVATLYAYPKGLRGYLLYMVHIGWKDRFKQIPGAKKVKKMLHSFKFFIFLSLNIFCKQSFVTSISNGDLISKED